MDRSHKEPKPPKGIPRCPAWLDPLSKHAWKQLLPQLQSMGILSRIDCNALVRYCRSWSRWIRAEQFIEKHGECYPLKDGNGKTKCLAAFPQVATANKLGMLLTKLEQEFGMTPSARTRIEVPAAPYEMDEEDRRMLGDAGSSFGDFMRRVKETE